MAEAGVCIATTRAAARLIARPTTPGAPTAWPMLAIDRCPYSPGWWRPHGHWHFITEPGPPWYRVAPCTRKSYLIGLQA